MTDRIWKTDCARCIHACSQTVHIGDTAYGNDIEECGCDVEDRLKDEDNELIDDGRCPLWCPDMDAVVECLLHDLWDKRHTSVYFRLCIDTTNFAERAKRLERIRELMELYRDPNYHDLMVDIVQSEGEEW